jgi:hypothetical protein
MRRKYREDTFEVAEARRRNSPKQVRIRHMRETLPYCLIKWEGREILYNRFYQPLWERDANGVVTRSTEQYRWKWVDERFYNESSSETTPWENANALKRCEDVLREWGVPIESY